MTLEAIKAAIKHFESLQRRYTTTHNGKQCELVKTALASLRECEERRENKPLTLYGLTQRAGKPVWVESQQQWMVRVEAEGWKTSTER